MKNTIKLFSLLLAVVLLVCALTSCGLKRQFVGTWVEIDSNGEESGEELVLTNNGKGSISEDGMSGSVTWSCEGDSLFLTISICGMTETEEYTYEFSGKTMTLTDQDGDETVYRKSK